ncbi:hypothetical protein WR164_04830 [Philodulcilactobacillus myokoensis]|uniref:MFS transporter n=1 Tax=Philodulcilactobacillus myokoensis TaxID=2929573 RepID=A0A9W6B008_9LACO|nr:MFS transporter [Philodulcilactobacillus myokoensis]GLB46504.1 hypothetical protein WR164_04830 [Philodulcilactobacillus myokoensis]
MIFPKSDLKNLIQLLSGQSLLLIGNSIFNTVLLYILAQQYNATSSLLGLFGIIAAIPPAFIAIGAPILGNIHNNKRILIILQLIAFFCICLSGFLLLEHKSIILIAVLYFLLNISTTISTSVEVGFIPVVFNENEEEIERSVDFQYFMSSGLTILVDIISSFILLIGGSTWLLMISFITPPIGIICYALIKYNNSLDVQNPSENNSKFTYFHQFFKQLHQFTHTMPAFLIILFEAILGGISGLLFELLPLTMKEIGVAVAFFSFVSSIQKIGDFIGGFLAPFVKWQAPVFFVCDYLISGACFLFITFPLPNIIRLGLLLIAGIVMGMSGNVFEKLMYRSYNVGDISSMHALTTTTFAIFSVTSYFTALIHVHTLILWQITGIITILFGILLLIMIKLKPSNN